MNLALYCVHLQACCSSGIRSQSRIRITSMVHKLKTGVFGSLDLSDIGIIILGAMHAGVLVILIVGQLLSCKGTRHTFPLSVRVEFGVLGLSWDFWGRSVAELQLQLQLEVGKNQLDAIGVEDFDFWRVYRWSESTEQTETWLMGIFILLSLRCRVACRRNEMRFSPLARGCSSSTSRWEGTIWDEIQHTPRLSASSEAEVKQRSHHVKLASKWRRIGAHLCCDYTGMGPGNMHSLTYMAITVCVFMCIGGVRSAASLMRLQRCVIPQDASIACLSCLVAWLENLFLKMLYPHRDMVRNTSCSTYKEQRCPVPALLSDSGEVTTNDGNPPSPYGWKGCEA